MVEPLVDTIRTQTICNGEELPNYDKFETLIKNIQHYFESVKDYAGYPKLPSNWLQMRELFKEGSETEKLFMFGLVSTLFIEALRHWKAEKDEMYPGQDSTPFYLS